MIESHPSLTRRFSGLRSRWATLCWCINRTPSISCDMRSSTMGWMLTKLRGRARGMIIIVPIWDCITLVSRMVWLWGDWMQWRNSWIESSSWLASSLKTILLPFSRVPWLRVGFNWYEIECSMFECWWDMAAYQIQNFPLICFNIVMDLVSCFRKRRQHTRVIKDGTWHIAANPTSAASTLWILAGPFALTGTSRMFGIQCLAHLCCQAWVPHPLNFVFQLNTIRPRTLELEEIQLCHRSEIMQWKQKIKCAKGLWEIKCLFYIFNLPNTWVSTGVFQKETYPCLVDIIWKGLIEKISIYIEARVNVDGHD